MKNKRVRIVLWIVAAVIGVCVVGSAGLYYLLPGQTRLLPVSDWGFGVHPIILSIDGPVVTPTGDRQLGLVRERVIGHYVRLGIVEWSKFDDPRWLRDMSK